MPADAINYRALSTELQNVLVGGRIDKIVMPDKSMIMLFIRNGGATHNLLITAAAQPRCFISKIKLSASATPPAFCLHLRKHIGGGIIKNVYTYPFERILAFDITSFDDLGEPRDKKLFIELMGKYSNVVVTDGENKISDALKHISADEGRPILPCFTFTPPPSAAMLPSDTIGLRGIIESYDGEEIETLIMRSVRGIAPATAKEAVYRSGDSAANLNDIINSEISPFVYYADGEPVDFSFCEYFSIEGERKSFDTLSEAMDEYYNLRFASKSKNESKALLLRAIGGSIDKQKKKLGGFLQEQENSADYENERILGELITANIYKFTGGSKSAEVYDWFSSQNRIITFIEATPAAAAQKHFAKYQKKKKTSARADNQITETSALIDYYESIAAAIENADASDDLAEIEAELQDIGILKNNPRKSKADTSKPRHFDVFGYDLIIGKNNIQNDRITKEAKGEDYWLHTQGIHGSHAVLQVRGREPTIEVIKKAAALTAFFSKAKMSQNVPVDYTKAKNVRKPKGSPPGKVDYVNQKTVFVNPLPPSAE